MSHIRFAEIKDIPALVEGGSRMHALTRFRDQPYDAQRVTNAFAELIHRGQGKYVFFVAENSRGAVVGALIGVIEQQIFSSALTASVMHFDVLPEARMGGYGVRLLKAFEQWAKNRNVIEINFGVNSGEGIDVVGRFALKMGYQKVGENYAKNPTPLSGG